MTKSHMNSIDKNSAGDYVISSRFTDTIFKISGTTGQIEWRLEGSGKMSDFVHEQNFNFSRQHDAQWRECNSDREIISFLDNASDGSTNTSLYSSVLMVELDKRSIPWIARVLKRWIRQDKHLSHLRGNAQFLGNGNIFSCWSDNSYLTEHSPNGDLLITAAFRSERFVTYRGYKFNFFSTPKDPPVLQASVYSISPERSTTVSYVSWNGATEVSSWSLYEVSNTTGSAVRLVSKPRTGFETSIHVDGYARFVYAEAHAANGKLLGRTPTYQVEPPREWKSSGALGEGPREYDRSSTYSVATEVTWASTISKCPSLINPLGCSTYGDGCEPTIPGADIHAALLCYGQMT